MNSSNNSNKLEQLSNKLTKLAYAETLGNDSGSRDTKLLKEKFTAELELFLNNNSNNDRNIVCP